MADNVAITAGTGTTIGADEIAAVKYQRIKMILGADGTNDGDVSSANPMPVTGTVTATTGGLTDTQLRASAVPVSLSSVPSHAVTNAGTFAVQVTSAPTTAVTGTFYQATQPVSIASMPSTPVTGTFWQATQPVSGTVAVTGVSTETTLSSLNGKVTACNTGAVVLAAGTANIGDVDVLSLPAIPAGTNNIGDVDIASIAAGDNNIGNVDVVTLPALVASTAIIGDVGISGARTSGGTTPYKNLDVDETEDEVKGTAGQVYWIHAVNLKATPLYLKFYNATAASVIVGTTVPVMTFPVPSAGATTGAGFVFDVPAGIVFSTAITIAATTGFADNDTGAPGANELIVNLGYA